MARREGRGAPESVFWRELMADLGLVDIAAGEVAAAGERGSRPGPVEGPAVVGGLRLRADRELPAVVVWV